ncbi:YhdP family protein [Aidingimonas lacisalsi]|uniref:YhdP family protein n=1 Tax=Aidingimonas lacisalsi TaxID=2604086 RepID=UPI0011D20B8F|nr:YhdP family protein [Aidingimonas lacisalsi]
MSRFRLLLRWALTLLAVGLGTLAILVLVLRILASQVDSLRPDVVSGLASSFNADVDIAALSARWEAGDPMLALQGLRFRGRRNGEPLLDIGQAALRVDTWQSLTAWLPVTNAASLDDVTLHLYQREDGSWHWPEPATLPPFMVPDQRFDLSQLNAWLEALLRQRIHADDVRVVLHGRDGQTAFNAPQLMITGDRHHTHIEGWVNVEGREGVALQASLDLLPGRHGLADFNAALQAEMDVSSLVGLSRLLPFDHGMRLEDAEGKAQLWGRWHGASLDDVRVAVDIPQLTLRPSESNVSYAMNDVRASGQWLRSETGWQAWLNTSAGDAAAGTENDGRDALGPALPRHWQAAGDADGWWLKTDAFDLASLIRWRERLVLPEFLDRWLAALSPRGRVTGVAMKGAGEEWRLEAALDDVAVDPWQSIPGGGPIDAWLELQRDGGGIRFAGDDGMNLVFPEIFDAPLALQLATGRVEWQRTGDRTRLTGDALKAVWRDAPVNGRFQLDLGGQRPGELSLDLEFADVNAIDTPVSQWLPLPVLDDDLVDWLSLGAAGIVEQGSVSLKLPLTEEPDDEAIDLQMALDVTQGRLPIGEDWPILEDVEGEVSYANDRLAASIAQAESHGIVTRDARVGLDDDESLSVTGTLEGTTEQWLSYLAAIPAFDADIELDAWEGRGVMNGELEMAMPLDDPEALELELVTDLDVPELRYRPASLAMNAITGQLTYRHHDTNGHLAGEVNGQLFGGPIQVLIDTRDDRVSIEGQAQADGLSDWMGGGDVASLVTGELPYEANLALKDGPELTVASDLVGMAIDLPAPFGKRPQESAPLRLAADLGAGELNAELDQRVKLRWREWGNTSQGQAWLERWPESPEWPAVEGWDVAWRTPRLDVGNWFDTLSSLGTQRDGNVGRGTDTIRRVVLQTDCLAYNSRCLGSLGIEGDPLQAPQAWRADVSGTLADGEFYYRPGASDTLDMTLSRLDLDALLPEAQTGDDEFLDEIATAPTPVPMPDGIDDLPDGRLRVSELTYQGHRLGPFTTRWRSSPGNLRLAPVSMTLGDVAAEGELVWEASGDESSLTRSRLSLDGGDVGTALERLGQPVTIRNEQTSIKSQLAWPGAPWQFGLERSRGNLDIELANGSFLNIDAPSAKLIGLLNVDNLLRRLRLDFSDVAEQGTSFDSVKGAATLYGGILETQGPVVIDGPATVFRLEGTVDLVRRELDQRLGVSVPVSQNLPLAAVAAGSPLIGGALFVAHQLFGGAIDRATQIHYRVRGPLTAPQISLEQAE